MSLEQNRQFVIPTVREVVQPVYIPEHDDFDAGLELNYEDIEPANTAQFAKGLVKDAIKKWQSDGKAA